MARERRAGSKREREGAREGGVRTEEVEGEGESDRQREREEEREREREREEEREVRERQKERCPSKSVIDEEATLARMYTPVMPIQP